MLMLQTLRRGVPSWPPWLDGLVSGTFAQRCGLLQPRVRLPLAAGAGRRQQAAAGRWHWRWAPAASGQPQPQPLPLAGCHCHSLAATATATAAAAAVIDISQGCCRRPEPSTRGPPWLPVLRVRSVALATLCIVHCALWVFTAVCTRSACAALMMELAPR
jgi:hypothetical protein